MDLVAKHGRGSGQHILSDQILADNDNYNTCRSHVLLHAAVDHTVFGDIHRLRKEAAGDISNKRMTLGVGKGLKLRAVDGIILTNIDIIRILGNVQIGAIRYVREGLVSRGSNFLLNIGPTADGRIPVIMQQKLIDIGDWLKVNGEGIYSTVKYKNTFILQQI